MSNHRLTIRHLDHQYRAVCECRATSTYGTRQEAEDWGIKHLEQIQKVRAHLRGRTPSLATQLAWFNEQADNPNNSARDRELWRQLADELEHRIRSDEPDEQEGLW